MGLLNQAIDIKNVVDFYEVKNFVETGRNWRGSSVCM